MVTVKLVEKIDKSEKTAIKMLQKEAMKDVRSTTGVNLSGIMLLASLSSIMNVTRNGMKNVEYYEVKDEDMWKIHIASESRRSARGSARLRCSTSRR